MWTNNGNAHGSNGVGNGGSMMRLPGAGGYHGMGQPQQQQPQQQQHHNQQQQQQQQQQHNQQQQQQQPWYPDPALLEELRARGPGQYRIHMRSYDTGFGGNNMNNNGNGNRNNMNQNGGNGLPMNFLNRATNFSQQALDGNNRNSNSNNMSSFMGQGQSEQMQQQQPQQQMMMHPQAMQHSGMHHHMTPQMQQQIQQWQAAQMAAAQQQQQQAYMAQNGIYSVDVVRNQSMGADVFLIQAGNFGGFPMQAKKSKKRRQRDPLAPKPARYAWNFFFKEHYKKIRNKNYGGEHFDVQKAFTDIGHSLGDKWKSLTAEEKEPYNKMAQEDKKRFEREMKEYTNSRAGDRGSDDDDDDDDASNAGDEISSPQPANDEKGNERNSSNSADDTVDFDESKDDEVDLDATPRPAKKARMADPASDSASRKKSKKSRTDDIDAGAPGSDLPKSFETEDGLKVNIIRPGEEAPAPNMTEMTADVLVTDDDETFIVMMSATLRKLHVKEGYQNLNIHVAHNGEEALKKIVEEKQRFAVVTMDKVMGELDGVETVKKMREAGYDGCVVGVTGDSDGKTDDFEQVGADKTLYKNQSGLFSQVHSILVEKLSDQDHPASDPSKESTVEIEEIKDEPNTNKANADAAAAADHASEKDNDNVRANVASPGEPVTAAS
ncbi:High mobility group protein-like NHP1 [Hondaea fermentalgiana]|uniref:High mobility group protein-like NHP1 n=1 Tax=Hondaea fermentalgiana TaxID=2315210 RepID=A0A2R5GYS8_9STRA|nr:High mobility group protein-like NHP1 [Hondaea fermentalgiana]|eukprot:GBG33154.1 High mobility group protein-like NHP1 [Hondaea fermentalgiana]